MTLIAQSQWLENKDPTELFLVFGIFFAVLAFITLIYWIFFMGDKGSSNHSNGYSRGHSGNRRSDQAEVRGYSAGNQANTASQTSQIGGDYADQEFSSHDSRQDDYSSTHESQQLTNHESVNLSSQYDYDSLPEMSQISRTQAEAAFHDDIFKSFARWDDEFGVIYIVPPGPEDVDDLTAISGISHAYQHEMHRIGIFMYKQITSWPNETCRNISKELNSGDSLFREDWPNQARQLHFDKYREKV